MEETQINILNMLWLKTATIFLASIMCLQARMVASQTYTCSDGTTIPQEYYCDFKEDCSDGGDEATCPAVCFFENGMCGWFQATGENFDWTMWSNDAPSDYVGPATDHTYNSVNGHYMWVDNTNTSLDDIAIIKSPTWSRAARRCMFTMWYYVYGSDFGTLKVRQYTPSDNRYITLLTAPDGASTYERWNYYEAEIFSCAESFHMSIQAKNTKDNVPPGGYAVDDIRLENCAYDLPLSPGGKCASDEALCDSNHCYPDSETCDFTLNCCDGTDESDAICVNYSMCDFESGWCDWQQLQDDDHDWTRQTGGTGTGGTGPGRDHTTYTNKGYYIYTEMNSPAQPDDTFRLGSFYIQSVTNGCAVRFYYHMRGTGIGALNVYTRTQINGQLQLLWRDNQDHGNIWVYQAVSLSSSADFQVIFEGVRGTTSVGDIALDDISMTPDCVNATQPLPVAGTPTPDHPGCPDGQLPCNLDCIDRAKYCDFRHDCLPANNDEIYCPSTCNFENDLCYWSQDFTDDFDWSWYQPPGADGFKGPINDHTTDTAAGHYIYVDGSSSAFNTRAKLISPTYALAARGCTFSLWYNMFGVEFGDLEIWMRRSDGSEKLLEKANDGVTDYNKWLPHDAEVPACSENFQIVIDGEDRQRIPVESGFAVDDIMFQSCMYPLPTVDGGCGIGTEQCASGQCYPASLRCDFTLDCCDNTDENSQLCVNLGYSMCDFETDFCDWTQLTTDEFDWRRESGGTSSSGTGPGNDHTLGNQYGYYIYTEASGDRKNGDRAKLASFPITGPTMGCSIRFYYHMLGTGIGTLNVYTRTAINGPMSLLWSQTTQQGNIWIYQTVNFYIRDDFQVVIEGVIGYTTDGDIALDDISFTPNCQKISGLPSVSTSPPPTTKPSHCINPRKFSCDDGQTCIDRDQVCDFKAQCPGKYDEITCPSACDFETDMCGQSETTDDGFDWVRASGANTVSVREYAPNEDHTRGNQLGYYVYVSPIGGANDNQKAEVLGPVFSMAAEGCLLTLYYYMSGINPGQLQIYLTDQNSGEDILLFLMRGGQSEAWLQAKVGIGRRQNPFQMKITKNRNLVYDGVIALDDMEYQNCALPDLVDSCDTTTNMACDNGACISKTLQCDFADDCGDSSDEPLSCGSDGFNRCNFDRNFCDWTQAMATDNFNWTRAQGKTTSYDGGPKRDHTTGDYSGFYLYLNVIGQMFRAKAQLLSRNFKANDAANCQMRFFYLLYGSNVDALNVYMRPYKDSSQGDTLLWKQQYNQGDYWQRGVVTLSNGRNPFQVVIEGTIGDGYTGNTAIDDISFTVECTASSDELPNAPVTVAPTGTPSTTRYNINCSVMNEIYCPASSRCLPIANKCDFKEDCPDGSDEVGCVQKSCNFESDLCGWRVDDTLMVMAVHEMFLFKRVNGSTVTPMDYRPANDHTTGTPAGWYLTADSSAGSFLDQTQLYTPYIQQTGPNCGLRIWYHMFGPDVDSLFVYTENDVGERKDLWSRTGGTSSNEWQKKKVVLGTLQNFRVVIQARRGISFRGDISLDDFKFNDCAPPVIDGKPCTPYQFTCSNTYCIDADRVCDYGNDCMDTARGSDEDHCDNYPGRCDFELDICDYHQDFTDDFDWTLRSGNTPTMGTGPPNDHTLRSNAGSYIYTEVIYPQDPNDIARLISPAMQKLSQGCKFRFWYYMDGNNLGSLNIYKRISYTSDQGLVELDAIVGKQGEYWQLKEVVVPDTNQDFEMVLEAINGNGWQSEIALDDLSFSTTCVGGGSVPGSPKRSNYTQKLCSDGVQLQCATNSQCYPATRHCDFFEDCVDGSDESNCGTSCNFEDGTCGWHNSDKETLDWTRATGDQTRLLKTGPETDHTLGTDEGYYMFIDTSSIDPGMIGGDAKEKAHMQTLPYQHSAATCTLSLWYHMKGSSIGTLTIYLKASSGQAKSLWSISDSQGNKWNHSPDIVIGHRDSFIIVIEAVRGVTVTGDIAIDDITLTGCKDDDSPRDCSPNEFVCTEDNTCLDYRYVCNYNQDCLDGSDEANCEYHAYDCTFDGDLVSTCGWSQLTNDELDWIQAFSSASGPSNGDHTSGTGQFALVKAALHEAGDSARIATGVFPPSTKQCQLRFWYFMNGEGDAGTLRVYTQSTGDNGALLLMWSLSNSKDTNWRYATIYTASYTEYKVVFEGIVANPSQGDIIIDDVTFTAGCAGTAPTFPPVKICPVDGFYCVADGVCLDESWYCDGKADCSDAEDEALCPPPKDKTPMYIALGVVFGTLFLVAVVIAVYIFVKKRKAKTLSDPGFGDSYPSGMDNPAYGNEKTSDAIIINGGEVGFTVDRSDA